MMLEPIYAKKFEFNFNIYKHASLTKSVYKGQSEYLRSFILAEELKMLFLINYAYIDKSLRLKFALCLDKELYFDNGKLVYDEGFQKVFHTILEE